MIILSIIVYNYIIQLPFISLLTILNQFTTKI